MSIEQNPASNDKIAIIILAGGSSSRLGKPKQLLLYHNQTLIKHAVKIALQTSPGPVIVVTGFLHEELVVEMKNLPVQIVHNPDWREGMGSSIRAGISALKQPKNLKEVDAAMILLCDQPLINAEHLIKLVCQFYSDKRSMIVATGYANTQGVPAIFDKSLFPVLENLPGNRGAQWIFNNYQEQLHCVAFEGAAIDVDTEKDYFELLQLSEKKQE